MPVGELVDLVTAFPAVVLTALLAFCLAWWLVATLAGVGDGFDSEPDADGALDDIGDALGISSVPPAIGLSIVSFVGWVGALGVTTGLRAADVSGGALAAAGVVALVLTSVAGVLVARPIAKRGATLFVTELAPSEREAIGALARVRSPRSTTTTPGGRARWWSRAVRSAARPAGPRPVPAAATPAAPPSTSSTPTRSTAASSSPSTTCPTNSPTSGPTISQQRAAAKEQTVPMEVLIIIGVVALVAAFLVFMAGMFVTRLYHKVEQGSAMVVNKTRSIEVTFTGALVKPVVDRAEIMDISVKVIEVESPGKDGLICRDNIRADIA